MNDLAEEVERNFDRRADDRLHSTIAVLVAVTATFMALCNIKDGNVVQAMSVARTKAVDTWAHYQAKSLKQGLAQAALDQQELELEVNEGMKPEIRARVTARVADYRGKVARYETEKEEIRQNAEASEREYAALNVTDDQFDIAEACLSLSLALFGITALTRRRGLLFLSTAFAVWGMVQGFAGFAGWNLRPDWLAKLLN